MAGFIAKVSVSPHLYQLKWKCTSWKKLNQHESYIQKVTDLKIRNLRKTEKLCMQTNIAK